MKSIDKNLSKKVVNKRKVIMYMIVGLGFGMCVGYTMAKLAHWLMNLN